MFALPSLRSPSPRLCRYPSIMIAYNMCFSTLMGRVARKRGNVWPEEILAERVGCFKHAPAHELLAKAFGASHRSTADADADADAGLSEPSSRGGGFVAKSGAIFAPRAIRDGLLPRMLRDLLETRGAVKTQLKATRNSIDALEKKLAAARRRAKPALRRKRRELQAEAAQLDARQLGIKLVMNVTYGYCSASFSGRMPNSVLADAIVGTGRATLQAAIARVEAHGREGAAHRWGGARVVYGDTDSLFVLLPGRSLREAFAVGKEIVAEVTAANPPPVKLKLECVRSPPRPLRSPPSSPPPLHRPVLYAAALAHTRPRSHSPPPADTSTSHA